MKLASDYLAEHGLVTCGTCLALYGDEGHKCADQDEEISEIDRLEIEDKHCTTCKCNG